MRLSKHPDASGLRVFSSSEGEDVREDGCQPGVDVFAELAAAEQHEQHDQRQQSGVLDNALAPASHARRLGLSGGAVMKSCQTEGQLGLTRFD